MTALEQTFPFTHCSFGVARRDVTPPVGIYSRSWGAATHDVAEGVHRPLTATAAVFAPLDGEGPTLALVALDIGWFQNAPDERALRGAVLERTGLGEAELLIQMSHTHAGANTNSRLEGKPGTELIAPVPRASGRAGRRRRARGPLGAAEAFVTYGYGRCGLAANRDLWDAEAERFACGYNPEEPADDTLLVAPRRPTETETVLATLFNYACHPTTLAWDNRLLSPDYIGAAREVLETAFDAPALFLQGASGELAPRDDYVGDAAVADRNGRQLGHAAAAAIEALPPPGDPLRLHGDRRVGRQPRRVGVPAVQRRAARCRQQLEAVLTGVELARKEDIGVVESVYGRDARLAAGAREGAAPRVPAARARGRAVAHDAALGLAARRGAARRGRRTSPTRSSRPSCAGASPGTPRPRPDDDERGRRLPAAAGDLRHGPLPGAAVAVRARLPRAVDRGRYRSARESRCRGRWSSAGSMRDATGQ